MISVSAGKPYTDSWVGEWKYLYTLERDLPNNGNFNFKPDPAASEFSSWELGAIRVSSSKHSDGAMYVRRHSDNEKKKVMLACEF